MALTTPQKTALKQAILAETDPGVIAARNIGNAVFLAEWCNGSANPAVPAWLTAASRAQLFEAMTITKFDTLTAGKRDAWNVMMMQAGQLGVDFRRNKILKAASDIWGADAAAVLAGLTEPARRLEVYLTPNTPENQKTESTVVALDRKFVGTITHTEVSEALNS